MIYANIPVRLVGGKVRGNLRISMAENGNKPVVGFSVFRKGGVGWVQGDPSLLLSALNRALIKLIRKEREERRAPKSCGAHLVTVCPEPDAGEVQVWVCPPSSEQGEWRVAIGELPQSGVRPSWSGSPQLRQAIVQEALLSTVLRQHWGA